MNGIRIWAGVICSAAIICAIGQMAMPEGKVQKAMKCVIGLFFACCVIAPLSKGISITPYSFGEMDLPAFQNTENLSQVILTQTTDTFKENIRQRVEEYLNEKGIVPQKVEVFVHVKEDSSIYISSLKIWLKDASSEKAQMVSQIISETTGVFPEIETED